MWHWSVQYCTHQYRNDESKWQIAVILVLVTCIQVLASKLSTNAQFQNLQELKLKDFSRIFKYFQAPCLFSSTFKGFEVFIPSSCIFKDFSSTLWTLQATSAVNMTLPTSAAECRAVESLCTVRPLQACCFCRRMTGQSGRRRTVTQTLPEPDLSACRPWAGSLLEAAPTHPRML